MRSGKISDSVLKRSVFKQIRTKSQEVLCGAGIGEDCAIFASADAFFSCVSEAAVAEKADMARVLVKCANNLATAGARPIAALITLILPQDVQEEQLKALMAGAEEACNGMRMQIAGGHTTVSSHVDCPIVSVTAYGIPADGISADILSANKPSADKLSADKLSADKPSAGKQPAYLTTKGAKPGQDIVLTKWIALEGTAILARRNKQRLLQRYPAHLVEEAEDFDRYLSVMPEAAVAVKSGVRVMHDASEGGILAALWELAESSGVGLTINMRKIPIRQETVEVCELCEVNPYTLACGGCLILVTDHGEALVSQLAGEGINAAVIGQITDSHDRLIYNADEKRYLDKPAQDEIFRTAQNGIQI